MALKASVGINVADIQKYATEDKNGKLWVNLTVEVFDQPNKYNQDVSVTLSQTKEERLDGKPKTYLGNGKVFWKTADSQERSRNEQKANENQERFTP